MLINGHKLEVLVDNGSQIVSIQKDLWERIGMPIRLDHVMVMESANKLKDKTMGLLKDLKVDISGYNFYLQVQVVKNTPYKMLLGLLFHTLTQAAHKHFTNGDLHITLTDPNMHNVIMVPILCKNNSTCFGCL